MKRVFLLTMFLVVAFVFVGVNKADAGYVSGYYRSNGTYVSPYYRSNPNGLNYDNYSYRSNQPLYNNSYGRYNTYKWNTPSYYTQSDYYSGYNSYRSNHYGW
ncbi:hypothetical protein ACFL08_05915 [Patescibacteria group bacterium]